MPFRRSEEVQKTVRGTVFPTNATDATLADPQAQLVQLLGHTRPAVAAQAQTMLIADIGQEHHVAPLAMRWWPVLPSLEPALCHAHQSAQMAARQGAAIVGNVLKPHGVGPSLGPMAFRPSMGREEHRRFF